MINRPKIFISHSQQNMAPTLFAMRIIELLGCTPIIAERQAKGSSSVNDAVRKLIDNCDAAIVIVTGEYINGDKLSPSSGVSVELGILESIPKFKNKYFVVIQDGVSMSAMNGMAWTSFSLDNLAPIAESILVELGSMKLFRNYYELPGSDMELHTLLDVLHDLRKLGASGVLNNEEFKSAVAQQLNKFIAKFVQTP